MEDSFLLHVLADVIGSSLALAGALLLVHWLDRRDQRKRMHL